jgi:hypothetical protein
VRVRLVAFGDVGGSHGCAPTGALPVRAHEGDGCSHGPASEALLTVAVDLDGMMVVMRAPEVAGPYTRNRSLVYMVQTLLLHEIYLAEVFAAFGPQLDARFGPQLRRLRAKYRPLRRERMVMEPASAPSAAPTAGQTTGTR